MHKKIGILGGLSPESTVAYYEHITRGYVRAHGDFGYPEILIYSVNFQQYVDWQHQNRWHEAADAMAASLNALHRAGADFGLISTNTMHIVFDEVQAAVDMPLISIVETTARAIERAGVRKVGLLGTVFTMREAFFREGLQRTGVEALVPAEADQLRLSDIIYQELCRGEIREESRQVFQMVIADLRRRGAEGVVLGCTEIPLLIQSKDCDLPLFDTTVLHAQRALEYATEAVPVAG
ncbi:amino acid racemase [uncultured Paludibaculum sp.]|uniref:amino acid racemase n=1 Tax=uncultured Paludibaculum sp. TaxID=1765020 RepID=UPI002AAAB6B0|nr:amino acid racemase [uncultured Paludibaculum sp.]